MPASTPDRAGTGAAEIPPTVATREVLLALLAEVFGKYERGAAELVAEFELPEITLELLMAVCLAAPEVDDLVVGFVRDDLRVVSLSDQTRQLVDRDVRLLEGEPAGWGSLTAGASSALARQISLENAAAAQQRLAEGRATELEKFILENPRVYQRVLALGPQLLARWVMLSLMRETASRRRGSRVMAAWADRLAPERRARLIAAREQRAGERVAPETPLRDVCPSCAPTSPVPQPRVRVT